MANPIPGQPGNTAGVKVFENTQHRNTFNGTLNGKIMNFELEYLWNLFTGQSLTQPTGKKVQSLEKEIAGEADRLKRVFLFFSPYQGVSIKDFIQFNQHSISRLISAVESGNKWSNQTRITTSIDSALLIVLDGLLEFLKINYPSEFDFSATISATCLSNETATQEQNAKIIHDKLADENIDDELRDIIISALTLSDREKFIYEDIRYIHSFTKVFLENLESLTSDKSVSDLLTTLNFNNLHFFGYLKNLMNAEFERALEISEKYKVLLIYKKETEQTIQESNGQYSLDHPSLSQLIIGHLEFERLFLKELDLANTEWVNSGVLDANYKVSLTVKQLAFYVYLNVECGIITEQRAKKIHQYVISHIDSHEKSGISEKSFKNAYYLHHAEDIRKVIEKISKMLAIARERY
ncbi:hypothetical protein [Pedobacter aquatilis]|uniref:hypothetical protein n=1 Tax=Pedobacter aquatilis TaxID=351343 RepID=UPI002931D929|nr:hypothetical protein [Pedobacter aquatilis]